MEQLSGAQRYVLTRFCPVLILAFEPRISFFANKNNFFKPVCWKAHEMKIMSDSVIFQPIITKDLQLVVGIGK